MMDPINKRYVSAQSFEDYVPYEDMNYHLTKDYITRCRTPHKNVEPSYKRYIFIKDYYLIKKKKLVNLL